MAQDISHFITLPTADAGVNQSANVTQILKIIDNAGTRTITFVDGTTQTTSESLDGLLTRIGAVWP